MIIHGNSTKFCSNILQNHVRNIWQDISTDFKNVAQVQIWRKILAIFKSDRLGATHPAPSAAPLKAGNVFATQFLYGWLHGLHL